MAAEDWVFLEYAIDVGRRHCPELPDETLWQVLYDITTHRSVNLPDGPSVGEIRSPSGGYPPVRQKWPYLVRQRGDPTSFGSSPPISCQYFVPDLERLFQSLAKSTSQPASQPSPPKETRRAKPKPAKKKPTQEDRLVELMQGLKLGTGLLAREVRKTIVGPYRNQYKDTPSDSAIARAYDAYETSLRDR
jgi:hypothetical protein